MNNNNTVSIDSLQAELGEITTNLVNGVYKAEEYPRVYSRISQIEADLNELQTCYKIASSPQ